MYSLKSPHEIALMQRGGAILRTVISEIPQYLKVGMTTFSVNDYIEKRIAELGGEPGFKKVRGYNWGSCICINEQIVHTPPSERKIRDADVVTIDTGVFYGGFHTDSAITVQVGTQDPKVKQFLNTGKEALQKALHAAKAGNRIGHISQAFQSTIEPAGYSIVHELTGHGIGRELHEDPYIPCFVERDIDQTLLLKPGMTLALEVMYTRGDRYIMHEEGGWSLKTCDNSIAATFEHTIAITQKKTLILT
jgi:methionyl aminopeptidase